jgi:hypothetical protein
VGRLTSGLLQRFSPLDSEKVLALGSMATMALLLVAYVLVVPPYEGFDETAHYSYISHLADRGEVPIIGKSRFDRTLAVDLAQLPRPYSSVPPFEQISGLTHHQFHETLPDSIRHRAILNYWSPRQTPAGFEPDPASHNNGAPGHPPLYYALMTLPYRLSASWSPGASHLFIRLLSLVLVVTSYLLFWKTVRLFDDPSLRIRLLSGGLLVLHAPSLVFEFGRIGNDSLVVLLFSATFFLLVRLTKKSMSGTRDYVLLGLVLGLGLITKIYFIATLVAVLVHIVGWSTELQEKRRVVGAKIGLLVGACVAVGGWWYVLFKMRYGVFFGTHLTLNYRPPETIDVGFIDAVSMFLRMFGSSISTFLWSGSWSFLRPTLLAYALCAPFFLLVLFTFLFCWRRLQEPDERLALTASATLLLPLVAGTAWYMIDAIRHGIAVSVVGGYYWLVAWPCLAVIYSAVFRSNMGRRILPISLAFLVLFELLGWWKQLLLFSGILVKMGTEKSGVGFVFPSAAVLGEVVDRLSGLGWPGLTLAGVLVAVVLRAVLLWIGLAASLGEQTQGKSAES